VENIIGVLILVTYFALLALERIVPARPLPKVRRWTLTGLGFFVLTMVLSGLAPALTAGVVGDRSVFKLTGLGMLGGAVVLLLVTEFANYVFHRTFHTVGPLWRWVHQLHHAAERLDVLGSAFLSPAEIMLGGIISSALVAILGVTPEAAALVGFFGVFNAMFQHTNVRTPRWLGYLIQRPESHSIHHARGVHAYNYANLPLFDILFGTFRNPRDFSPVQGFWDGASAKLGSLLIGRDVAEMSANSARVAASPALPRAGVAQAELGV